METGCTCKIEGYIVQADKVDHKFTSKDMWEAGSTYIFTDGVVNGIELKSTPTAVNAVKATLTANFTVVPKVVKGSKIKMTLPSQFPSMSSSTPNPTCTTSLPGATCTIASNYAELTGFETLNPGTSMQIQITGMRNPTSKTLGAFVFTAETSGS